MDKIPINIWTSEQDKRLNYMRYFRQMKELQINPL